MFIFVLKFTFNFILKSNNSLHFGLWFYQALRTIKLIWFSIFYLPICICKTFLKLRLECYVIIAKYKMILLHTILIWFVSNFEKQIKVSFTKISKSYLIACYALSSNLVKM